MSSSRLVGIAEIFVVQDTWNEEDDVELRDYLESLPQEVLYLSAQEILELSNITPHTKLFCDTQLIQELLGNKKTVTTNQH